MNTHRHVTTFKVDRRRTQRSLVSAERQWEDFRLSLTRQEPLQLLFYNALCPFNVSMLNDHIPTSFFYIQFVFAHNNAPLTGCSWCKNHDTTPHLPSSPLAA